jgi:hypothetical protein
MFNFKLNNDDTGYVLSKCDQKVSGAVTIPDNYSGLPVVSIGKEAFADCVNMTDIVIPESVEKIEAYAFFRCSGLTNLVIPDSVKRVNSYAFHSCTSLKNITFSKKMKSIEEYSFNNCTALTDITIPDNITKIKFCAFYGCSGLTSVTIPKTVVDVSGLDNQDNRNVTYKVIGLRERPETWLSIWARGGKVIWDYGGENIVETND